MSFTATAENIRLDNGVLYASLRASDGSWSEASFVLTEVIGNDNGKFSTPGDNFLASTQDCWLKVEDRTILAGQLVDIEGNIGQDEFDLDELLGNTDGAFEWTGNNQRRRIWSINHW